jgi:hypothetical protein
MSNGTGDVVPIETAIEHRFAVVVQFLQRLSKSSFSRLASGTLQTVHAGKFRWIWRERSDHFESAGRSERTHIGSSRSLRIQKDPEALLWR